MSIFSYLLPKKEKSASVAKERLQIIVARERATRGGPDYLPQLQEELLMVVRKYVPVDQDAVNIQLDRESGCEILELNITLPEQEYPQRGGP